MKAILFAWSYDSHVALKSLGYKSQQEIALPEIYQAIEKMFSKGLNVALFHSKNSEDAIYVGADFKFPELAVDMGIKGSAHTRPLNGEG